MSEKAVYPFEKLWNHMDPAGTEAAFRRYLDESDLPAPHRAELLTQISRACCLQRHHAEARAALEAARPLLAPGADRARVRWLLEFGRLENELGTEDRGVGRFEEAWRLAGECGEDFYAVDAAHMLGYVLDGEEGVRWHEAGLTRVRGTDDARTKRWHFRLLSNLGKQYVRMRRFDEALRVYEEAIQVCEDQDLAAETRRDARWNVAHAYRSAGEAPRALGILRELEAEVAATAPKPDGYVFEEIAECLLALDRPEDARAYFARAWEQHRNDPWFPPTDPARLQRIKELGEAE
jgi:tetratricopeptide (TPR) repeat protein